MYNVSLEQLEWRRWCIKNNCGGDIDKFKQEYPISPEEAFLSTGKCYFNKQNIINRINELKDKNPIMQGSFSCFYDGIRIRGRKFNKEENGSIKIYKYPENNVPYVIRRRYGRRRFRLFYSTCNQ